MRLLATADPIEKTRFGQPLAKFGRLNIDYALMNPKMSHFVFQQQNADARLDGDILPDSKVALMDPAADVPTWRNIVIDEVLSIRSAGSDGDGQPLYRLVLFDNVAAGGTAVIKDRVRLNGCLITQSRGTGDMFIFIFEAGCSEAGALQDQSKVISGVRVLIAPTLGKLK
jgi:hypothetical protein